MKVTKVDGISHKKYIEEGKLVKSTSEENRTSERLSELLSIRLDIYIKNPDNASEEENRIRRENLKKFFSNKVLHLKDSVLYLKNRKEKNAVQDKNYSEEDISEYDLKNKNSFSVLKKILLNEDINSEELEIFRKDVEAKLNKINSLKYSFEENKANYQKINENNVEKVGGKSKRNIIYDYYRESAKRNDYINNVQEAFDKLYKKEDIETLFFLIENSKKHEKYKIREYYHKIIGRKNDKENFAKIIYEEIQNVNNIKELIEKVPNMSELKKSQVFYKYYLDKEELNDKNIKYAFCHFVEIEMSQLLKNYVYKRLSNISNDKIKRIFEYQNLKKLIENKLLNKLDTYVRNCGKYNYYLQVGEIATSDFIARNRQNEAFLRNIIGVSSVAYFSLRNILETENENDITGRMRGKTVKNNKGEEKYVSGEVDKIYNENKQNEVKENLKMFYSYDFNMDNKNEIEDFFANIDEAISSIRHGIVHFNLELEGKDIFAFKNIVPSEISKKMFQNEINEKKLKLKIFRQLNSANVFRYLEKYKILNYLKRTRFEFVNKNIPFVPSFTKLYSRIDDLKNSLGIYWKTPKTNDDNKTKEIIDAQIYLLKNIYYGEFLNYFMSNNGNFFEISREIIELNKNDKRNLKTGFYKLQKFEDIQEKTPKKYLANIQSLYMINAGNQDEEEKDTYIDFIQKIFLKGFMTYLANNGRLSLMYIGNDEQINTSLAGKKQEFDKFLKKYEQNNNIEIPHEINEFLREIKLGKILKYTESLNMFYLILKLLNHKELTNLKGSLEKYQSANKEETFSDELELINLLNLDNNRVTEDFELEANEIGKFLDFNGNKIKDRKELKKFDTKKIYFDGENIIKHRAFYNIKKYGMLNLLEKIADKAKYKISLKELKEYSNKKNEIEKNYTMQQNLHRKYARPKKDEKFNDEDYKEYEKAIGNIQKYTHLKNKVEFNELNLLQGLLLKILHRLVGYTSIWERDLRFRLKGEFPENQYIEEIFNFDNSKNVKYKSGQIVEKYINFYKELYKDNVEKRSIYSDKKVKKLKQEKKDLYIRNYIAHFNYIPHAEISLLEVLENLRKLLSYDRKLKNAIMKSVVNILKEYGFVAKFKIGADKKIGIQTLESEKIVHLKNLKKKKLMTDRNSEELCKLVKVMFEYKMEEKKSEN
ncbi:type VI-A CRISPR-associated RNA-guided ribonuclease Cas13a [Leptotrichia wadei]|uniref:type VI-A CRISPR-associated RNA-guided ribonuclease Cas13a n=1 Tax=Leptotrichia wadei TaxID=157687 RepID=UPI0028DC54E9|nr:type VI-A CRISPR-associated RNA-guided ribonuclease Cas13a [Leptotrichia wadei]